jgi:hypothetical protein
MFHADDGEAKALKYIRNLSASFREHPILLKSFIYFTAEVYLEQRF